MAEIQLRNLSKRWGSFVGVHEFDLTIADKEFLVLLGPSGCGKTTTMRMIAGLEDATEGDILVDGKRVNDLEPKDRDVAMVFQSYALYPNMNVYENIRFPLRVRGVDPKTHERGISKSCAGKAYVSNVAFITIRQWASKLACSVSLDVSCREIILKQILPNFL